eukprot:CAMPEP_0195325208 /NCGR_PEP_ID=MMETSP0708-20121125/8999_1 /TAXON_ID=33640 /ORGANISM="Asterionellopsis glacialis, Strain CCMP134" /LENGTH=44 /DNA_ID= /DNA_START= /DNA_END= /DNA_ORIENTATION=
MNPASIDEPAKSAITLKHPKQTGARKAEISENSRRRNIEMRQIS